MTVNLSRHPTDSRGRPLPDGSWPDQFGTAGSLEVVRRFCNTTNREHGAEAWRTPAEVRRWLAREGFPAPRITGQQQRLLIELRDVLWRSIVERSLDPLAGIIDRVGLEATVQDRRLVLVARRPGGGGVATIVAAMVTVMLPAQHDGSWARLKACEHCGWVYYDASKNRSRRWCSMQACGGRLKAKNYRRRITSG